MAPEKTPKLSPAQFERAAALFAEALTRATEARDVEAYAASSAPDDPEVAEALKAMIRAHLAEEEGNPGDGLEARADAVIGSESSAAAPSLSPTLPASIGGFRILRHLGAGGMGTVYQAEDATGRRHVALKVLHPWLAATPEAVTRFRREAQTGIAIQHENVVRALEFGSEEDETGQRHFFVMEYVEGKTLRTLKDELGRVPESLLTEIGRQTARGLEAIHAQGILHRDLKPENILITDDQRVRIMDLGIAKGVESSVNLTRQGYFLGSLAYSAPEQSLGEPLGPAVDLYALGVLLYELASGANPFRRDAPMATIRAHSDTHAAPLASIEPTVTPFFSAVVGTLLSKEPEDRFPSSTALLEALTLGERSQWWKDCRVGVPSRPRVAVGRARSLRGREEELDRLRDAVATIRRGTSATVLVIGEAGSGKTRLVAEFLAEPTLGDVELLYGGFSPHAAFGGLLNALRARFGESDAGGELASFLSGALLQGVSEQLADAVPSAGLQVHDLTAALVQIQLGLSSERPLVWVVEDIHFASEEERKVICTLVHASLGHPILMLLTARPTPSPLLEDLHPEPVRVEMSRLGEADVTAILEEEFNDTALALQLGAAVTKRSDGVPLFVLGIIQALKQQGFVRESTDGYGLTRRVEELTVPDELQDQIAKGLDALSPAARRVVDAAAVAGFEFDPSSVSVAIDEPLVRVLQELAELERFAGLVRSDGRAYRFAHHLVYEVAYEQLPLLLRTELHTRLGDAVQDRRGPCEEAVHHHLRGTRPEAALEQNALEETLVRCNGRAEAGEDHCRRALEIEGLLTGERRAEILRSYADFLHLLGKPEETRTAIKQAEEIAETHGLTRLATRARIFWLKVELTLRQLSLDELLRLADDASKAARALGDDTIELEISSLRVVLFASMGRTDDALAACCRSQELAIRVGDRRALGSATNSRAIELFKKRSGDLNAPDSEGDIAQAEAMFEEALAIGKETDNVRLQLVAHGNHGMLLLQLGRFKEARPHVEQQRTYSVSTGDLRGEAMAFDSLGLILASEGRLEEAVAAHRRGMDLMSRFGYVVGVLHSRIWAGGLLVSTGDLTGARAECEAAIELAKEIGDDGARALALAAASEAETAAGDFDEAFRLAEEAWDLAKKSQDSDCHVPAALARASVFEARGDANGAYECLKGAAERADLSVPPRDAAPLMVRVALHEGDVARAQQRLGEFESRIGPALRMELHYRLYRATNDRAQLDSAHELLQRLLRGVSDEQRDAMRAVRLHRSILDGHDTQE